MPGYLSTESLRETINSECRKYNKWLYFWLSFYIVLDALLGFAYVSIKKLDTQHALLVGILCTTLGLFGIFMHASHEKQSVKSCHTAFPYALFAPGRHLQLNSSRYSA